MSPDRVTYIWLLSCQDTETLETALAPAAKNPTPGGRLPAVNSDLYRVLQEIGNDERIRPLLLQYLNEYFFQYVEQLHGKGALCNVAQECCRTMVCENASR